jgi:hypothetical protein
VVHSPLTVSEPLVTTPGLAFGEGVYDQESDGALTFRWLSPDARLLLPAADVDQFLELTVHTEFFDLSQTVTVTAGTATSAFPLRPGWTTVSAAVPAGTAEVRLAVNRLFPREYYAAQDKRSLAIRVRRAEVHADRRRHANACAQETNWVLNEREKLEGRTSLTSTPPHLGIDMHGACNVKPPCVYCEWDGSKEQEGDKVDVPFTLDTLNEWGPFFENSSILVNCSIGEPFLMRNLDEVLDAFGDSDKYLELTTNGQILTDRSIQRLVGRRIRLHVSLDAGTAETYAKLRNNRFDAIIRNLERLIAAKGGPGPYPHIHLVFMPMRVNLHELPAFVDIAARLKVELLVLRPLNFAIDSKLNWDRAGYRFEYLKELLPFDELVRASGRAAELCERAGVKLADQMNFGGKMDEQFHQWFEEGRQSARPAAETASARPAITPAPPEPPVPAPARVAETQPSPEPAPPIAAAPLPSLGGETIPPCSEPWDSLYILRRGVLPCCYGAKTIAPMEEYREAWNGPLLQDIRRELAAGRFHTYCLESPSCPIVRKEQVVHPPPPRPPEPPAPPRPLLVRVRSRAARIWRNLTAPPPAAPPAN